MTIVRRMSLILALALIVTVGGVYAAWTYSEGAPAALDVKSKPGMASINAHIEKGSITTAGTSNLAFKVDDATPDNAADYTATVATEGSASIKFVPASAGVDEDVKTNGIRLMATVTVTNVSGTTLAKYENDAGVEVAIFSAKAENTFLLNGGNKCAPGATITFQASEVMACLDFCENTEVTLPSYGDYTAFAQALNTYQIVITISEAPAP